MFGAHTSYKERKIFVGNLSLYSDEEGLKNHFSQFGEVTDVNILKHPETQRSRRFGFVSFSANSSVEAALNADPSTQVLDNMKLDIRRAFKQSFEDGGVKPVVGTKSPFVYKDNKNKIFVGGISKETTLEDLKTHFGKFGPYSGIDWPADIKNRRGYAFITYKHSFFAFTACQVRFQAVKGKFVEVKMAIPKSEILNAKSKGSQVKGVSGQLTSLSPQNQPVIAPLYPIEALYQINNLIFHHPVLLWPQQNSFSPVNINQNDQNLNSFALK